AAMLRVPDPPLTEVGREQAVRVAAALKAADIGAAALYASPMRRAIETAHALSSALQLPPPILSDLSETSGRRDGVGMCRDEILQEWPDCVLDVGITEQGWWTPCDLEEAEDLVYARAARSLSALRERHQEAGETIVIVTHGAFGSALLSTLLGM